MTPKEKARELYRKFYNASMGALKYPGHTVAYKAKRCAMITVNEVIEQWEVVDAHISDGDGELNPNLKYWYEVREELNKL